MDSCVYKYSTGRVAIYSWAPGWLLEACYAMSCGSEFNILFYFKLLDTISAKVGVMRQHLSTNPSPPPHGTREAELPTKTMRILGCPSKDRRSCSLRTRRKPSFAFSMTPSGLLEGEGVVGITRGRGGRGCRLDGLLTSPPFNDFV